MNQIEKAPVASLQAWLNALRVRQYVKNVLVFVPVLTAHAYSLPLLLESFLALVAFSICASSAYIFNDLVDVHADRQHPTKRHRAFASGAIPVGHGKVAIPLLLVAAFACATVLSLQFLGVLAAYFALTVVYSLGLKRRLMIDVVALGGLYTMRVVAGAVATHIALSEWLLAFSMFVFTCLALVKRYIELARRIQSELSEPPDRKYRLIDLPVVGAMAVASGFNAVTIFTLYVSSAMARDLYRHPALLWFICPILVYWLGRTMLLAHRGMIDDDPIVFALGDPISYVAAMLMVAIVLVASY